MIFKILKFVSQTYVVFSTRIEWVLKANGNICVRKV